MHPSRAIVALLLSLVGCGGTVATPTDGGTGADGAADTALLDAAVDTGAPPDGSIPDVTPPDTGVPLSAACAAAGGALCTEHRWTICPKGFEPIASGDGHLGCATGGWCCVAAPASTCSSSGRANCVPGACTGCWSKVTDPTLTCESGRSCCEDLCD